MRAAVGIKLLKSVYYTEYFPEIRVGPYGRLASRCVGRESAGSFSNYGMSIDYLRPPPDPNLG